MSDIQVQIAGIQAQLASVYPAEEAREMAWWIAEETTGFSRSQLLSGCKGTTNLSNTQEIIERLLHFEPIQYVFGHTFWCGLDLKVSPATLIPRPETGELVERVRTAALTEYRIQTDNVPLRILDIGTGSGCIAIALKKRHPEWDVTGIDVSEEALEIAKENAQRNGVDVRFEVRDIFGEEWAKSSDEIGGFGGFDIVVSNPPYVRESEKKGMRKNVLEYEPATALFVPDEDPLKFYRRIAELHLGKQLFFEINEAFGQEMRELLERTGYTDIRITRDLYGKERIIEGRMA